MSRDDNKETVLPRVSDLYGRLFEKSWLASMIAETLVICVVVMVFSLMMRIGNYELTMFVTVFTLIVSQSLVGYFILRKAMRPTEILLHTIAELDGETTAKPAARRNDPALQKAGLSAAISSLYSIKGDSSLDKANTSRLSNKSDQLIRNIVSALPVGMIALDENRNIIAMNSLAPTYLDNDNHRKILLNFTTANQSLDNWLDQVSDNNISADNIWARVENVVPGSTTERKVFDVIAHYQKDAPSGIDTMIITVDRTAEYENDENSMDFIALAAHELRGPITVVRGYLDILDYQLADKLSPDQHELIDRLNVSAKRLSSYINNILNASRYDRQHLKLSLRESKVEDIISDIKSDMDLRAETLNRHIRWQLPENLPTVAADRSSISEVLSNLIDNAIKYSTDGGTIEVFGNVNDGFVEIAVRDYGMGIPSVVAEHLFSKFYRSHRSRGAVSGTGLGLYISRAIVESHGGHIGVQSTEGKGSVFTFTLPIYSTVADKLAASSSNEDLIRSGGNWIRNHSRIQG